MGESACVMQPVLVIPTEAIEGDPLRGLNDSISFGQFAAESLSWEKWSTFSHKKYVEEAERYSKPGSVAEKKAFFEAHYKKKASMKAAALLEQANNVGLDSVTVPSKSQDTRNGELKDHTQEDGTLSDGGLSLESKKEENDMQKDEGGGFAPENIKINELGRNPREQKQDAPMETPPPKELADSLTSSSLDSPPKKKRTSFVMLMCGSRSRPKTQERAEKRKEIQDKAETRRSWRSCFCFGAGQLEDIQKLPTDKVAAVSTTALNGVGKPNIQLQRLDSRGV